MKWHKGIVEWTEGRTAFISVVFSWDVDSAYSRAVWFRQQGYSVRVGGPGINTRKKELADVAEVGGDIPDTVVRHNPQATFASRGCPVGCWFCIVPKFEGRDFTLIEDFPVRPVLCDNNLSALPADFQDHIVARYRAEGVPLLDANSGFEPRTFDEEVWHRWDPINRGPWRFAYDDEGDGPHVERVMQMLKPVNPSRKRVYVLIGNEPVSDCMARIRRVLDWGGEPHVQPIIKLNAKTRDPWVRFDWTHQKLKDMARWANRYLYRYVEFSDYRASAKTPAAEQMEPLL